MARRASSGINPVIILVAIVIVGAVIFGGRTLLGGDDDAFPNIPRLSIDDFLKNGNSMQKSTFVVEGEIDEKIQFSSRGTLVSVKMVGEKGDGFIAIEIPNGLTNQNIETKQKYAIKVEFKKGGIAVAQDIRRL